MNKWKTKHRAATVPATVSIFVLKTKMLGVLNDISHGIVAVVRHLLDDTGVLIPTFKIHDDCTKMQRCQNIVGFTLIDEQIVPISNLNE